MVARMRIVNFIIKPTDVNTIWPRATKFGTVKRVGEERVSMRSMRGCFDKIMHVTYPKAAEPQHSRFLVLPTYAHTVWHSNQILHGDKKILQGRPLPRPGQKIVTQTPTLDLFAVANLVYTSLGSPTLSCFMPHFHSWWNKINVWL